MDQRKDAECGRFGCLASDVAVMQTRQHNEVREKLDMITTNQDRINDSIGRVAEILLNLNHLTNDFKDFRHETKQALDGLFERMRIAEQTKADKNEVDDMKRVGLSWIWQLLLMVGAALFGAVLHGLILGK